MDTDTVQHAHAKHEVAHGARIGTPRATEATGDRAAERAAIGEARRLEREHLAARAHRALDRGERGPGARREHELRRFVVDDAGVDARIDDIAGQRSTVEVLGAAAANPQRRAGLRCDANPCLQRFEGRIHHTAPAAFSLSRYRMRGSSASMIVVSANAASSHCRRNGWARSAARYTPAAPAGWTPYVWNRNATGA